MGSWYYNLVVRGSTIVFYVSRLQCSRGSCFWPVHGYEENDISYRGMALSSLFCSSLIGLVLTSGHVHIPEITRGTSHLYVCSS